MLKSQKEENFFMPHWIVTLFNRVVKMFQSKTKFKTLKFRAY